MALIVPGADYRQLRGKSRVPLSPQVINVHTMAGTLAGTESWFSGAGRPYSHLGTGGGAELRQWQDLRFRAASDLEGNPRCISIENEDRGGHFPNWSGSDVPEFTDAQADLLVVTLSWLCHRFGLPKSAIGSSCTHERGIGWHRLGIDPWRTTSCPRWSHGRGKACPGDRRIAQLVNEIVPQVSAPSSPSAGGFLMGLTDAQQTWLYDRVLRIERALTPKGDTLGSYRDSEVPDDRRLGHLIARLDERLDDNTVRWIYQRLQRLEQALTSSESGSLGTFDSIEEERTLRSQVLSELAEIKAAVSGEAS